jgi:hypothetical protein
MESKVITSEQLLRALDTSHDTCNEDNCIHAEAVSANYKRCAKQAFDDSLAGLKRGEPAFAAWYAGMHVGFRLAMIMFEDAVKETNANSGS